MIKETVKLILPLNSKRRKSVKKILTVLHLRKFNYPPGYYNTWYQQLNENIPLLSLDQENHDDLPLISIIVPVYNPKKTYIDELVYSIISQAYEKWELILVNASSQSESKENTKTYPLKDSRIKIIDIKNKGISTNTNEGIKKSKGDYLAFADHDDLLHPFALYEASLAIKNEEAELVYTDEDKVSADGENYYSPHFKPDWSPDLLTHVNYINHLTIIKRSLLDSVGLLDPEKDGAQDYDLLLRAATTNPKVAHVPKVLYHWRAAETSTAHNFESKPKVTSAATQALQQYFKDKGIKKEDVQVISQKNRPGFYDAKFKPYKNLSLIITPFASDATLRLYVELLLQLTKIDNIKLDIIVPEGVVPKDFPETVKVKSIPASEEFLLEATKVSNNNHLVIINQILFPEKENWLNEMSGYLRLNHVGALSPVIVRDDKMIEDAGLVIGSSDQQIYLFRNLPMKNHETFFGNTDWIRDVNLLTGNCIVVRKNELVAFLEKLSPSSDFAGVLKKFSDYQVKQNKFNVIYSKVLLNNHSIRLQPHICIGRKYFNPNIFYIGDAYELYTPEQAAINIMLRLQEIEQAKDE